MTSLRTDFEMHAYGQDYGEKHLKPVNTVTRLFGDGDLDADHGKVKASAVEEFAARKKPRGDRESPQAQECQPEVVAMTDKLDKSQVEADAMASRAHELTCTIAPDKEQGTYWGRIKCKKYFGNLRKLSKDK
jgi:hypothetical protein